MEERVIHVYLSIDEEIYIGKLYAQNMKGKEVYSFELSEDYLKSKYSKYKLDPDINNYVGRQYLSSNKLIFGFLSDSCPDRWGRQLIKRKELEQAKEENRKPRQLTELDYLLSIYDESRMGALRFKEDFNGDYLSSDKDYAVPPWVYIRTLEEYALKYDFDESIDNLWIKNLLIPGSSLGGARPKASVYSSSGELWIAKFPSKKDSYDVGAWEAVAYSLASLCKLNISEYKLEKYSKYGSTFLTKRFDRNGNKRIHFSSFMTCLNASDGQSNQYSYLDIASYLKSYSYRPNDDLKELWKRIIFNMAISNTDDHLRNHGILIDKNGIKLSPLYDINPTPYGDRLSLNINSDDNLIDVNNLIETYKYYNLGKKEAIEYYNEIVTIVNNNWERVAKEFNISNSSIETMRRAFSLKTINL